MKKYLLSLVFVYCVSVTYSVAAEEDAKVIVAKKLITIMNVKNTYEKTLKVMLDNEVRQKPMIAAFKDVIEDFQKKYMSFESIEPEIIKIYVKTYSEAEMKEMIAFFSTEVGRKWLDKSSEIKQQILSLGQAQGRKNEGELKKAIDERIKEQKAKSKAAKAPVPAPVGK